MTGAPMTVADTRRFLAEEIRVAANIRAPRIVDAIASVPRDRFLPPGPWTIRGVADAFGPPRTTDDADARHVHHDVVVAIDASRQLYNGLPSLIARWFQELGVSEGQRVVHIGTGTGYFTALLAHIVGPTGRVQGIEVDENLARQAAANLVDTPWVSIEQGNGSESLSTANDVVLVHAGATHVLDAWLDALGDGGRLLVPLTVAMSGLQASGAAGPAPAVVQRGTPPAETAQDRVPDPAAASAAMAHIGKGMVLLVTRGGDDWRVRPLPMPVAIYSLEDVRDEACEAAVGQAMATGRLMRVTRLRRDVHDACATCVVHSATTCLTAE